MCFHRCGEVKLCEVCFEAVRMSHTILAYKLRTFLHSNLGGARLRLFLRRRVLVFLHAPYLCTPVSIRAGREPHRGGNTLIMVVRV